MPVFPSQNLFSQKICETYDRLLQIYSGSLVLDGTGSQKQYLNITASYALNCASNCVGFSVTQSFSSSVWTFNHNLGDRYVVVQAYDDNNNQIIPEVVNLFDDDTTILTFSEPTLGTAVATAGGIRQVTRSFQLVTGSTYPITSSYSLTTSYVAIKNVGFSIKRITGSYNVTLNDYTLLCDATSGSFDVVLPDTSKHTQIFNIKKIDKSGHQIHVYTVGSKYIDYDLTQSISHKGTNMNIQSDKSQYWVL